MKKIISILLSCVLCLTLFAGCGSHQKSLDEKKNEMINNLKGKDGKTKELTEGTLFNSLAGTAPNSKGFYILNKDKEAGSKQSIIIEMNIDKDNKETEIADFIDKTAKLVHYFEEDLVAMKYDNLLILMHIDGKFKGNSISYIVKDSKLEIKDTVIDEEYYDDFKKAKDKIK